MATVAIVVTYNRKELLQECLEALLSQSCFVDRIIVVNNASTDGTEKLFENGGRYRLQNIQCVNMETNLGGAGGFSEGIKLAVQEECDWIWIMDDDTIPTKDALLELYHSKELLKDEKVSFLASSVYGIKDEPMNVPEVWEKPHENGYKNWYYHLEDGLIRIKSATFVSILVKKEAVINVGIPLSDYFIWGDDTEYTRRLTTYYGPAYMCGKSKVIHKRFNAKALSVINEDNESRLKIFHYLFRNNLINYSEYEGKKVTFNKCVIYIKLSLKTLFKPKVKHRWKKFLAIQKGIWEFLLKKYDYKQFNNRLNYFKR